MILGFFWMVVANGAVLLAAHTLLRRLATGNGAVDLVFFFILRFLLISAAVLLAGWTHQLTAAVLGIAGALALALLLLLGEHRKLARPQWPDFGKVLPILAMIVVVRHLLQVWFFAPYNYDALSYHLTKIPEWVRAGGFTRQMGVDTHAPFPAGFELIETWWVVFLHHDVLIEMAGLEFLALGAAATYSIARTSGLGDRSSFFAALVYALTPGIQVSATSCLNDVPVAALVLATAAFLAARVPLAWALLALGLGIGVKPIAGYAIPGLILLAVLVRSQTPLGNRSVRLASGLAVAASLVGISWYLRNWIWYGNPIYPVGTKGLINSTGRVQIQFGPSFQSGIHNLSELVSYRLADDYQAYNPLIPYISGWGPIGCACGALALLIAVRERPALRPVLLGLTASLVSILFLVNHDPWCLRFVLFYPAIIAVAVAHVVEGKRPLLLIAGAALAYQFLATCLPADLPFKHFKTLAAMGWRERSMARVFEAESSEPAVAYHVREANHNRGESYLLYRPDYSCRVVYPAAETPEELGAEMDRAQVRHLYLAKNNPPEEPLIMNALRRKFLEWRGGRFLSRP